MNLIKYPPLQMLSSQHSSTQNMRCPLMVKYSKFSLFLPTRPCPLPVQFLPPGLSFSLSSSLRPVWTIQSFHLSSSSFGHWITRTLIIGVAVGGRFLVVDWERIRDGETGTEGACSSLGSQGWALFTYKSQKNWNQSDYCQDPKGKRVRREGEVELIRSVSSRCELGWGWWFRREMREAIRGYCFHV